MKTLPGSRHLISILFPMLLIMAVYFGRQWYFTTEATTGDVAPNFTATTIDGRSFSLEDSRGAVTLLHFWGSWCGPCRAKHPGLVTMKKQLGDDLNIISIGIEKEEANWKAAIKKDNLFWPDHILDRSSSLKFLNGPISDLYGVNEVPTDFLLDKEGNIIATNPNFMVIRQAIRDAG